MVTIIIMEIAEVKTRTFTQAMTTDFYTADSEVSMGRRYADKQYNERNALNMKHCVFDMHCPRKLQKVLSCVHIPIQGELSLGYFLKTYK